MQTTTWATWLAALVLLSSCGGGGGGGGSSSGGSASSVGSGGFAGNGPTPAPAGSVCSLLARQQFVRDTFDEWYLFPGLLDTSVNPASFSTVQAYIDALVAPARAQSRDRFFSFVTSIAEENAFFDSGASAGFGVRLFYDTDNRRTFVIDSFEGAPALGASIDRGTELLAIGTNSNNLITVNSLMASQGAFGVFNALGPDTPGTMRVLRIRDQSGVEREVSLTKTTFDLDPVSDRFGTQIINDSGRQVGYLNLRTFIGAANDDLRAAYDEFRREGVTELIIDFRYNGGGAISTAELMADLMGRDFGGQLFDRIAYRPSKSQFNEDHNFMVRPQSMAPTKIAFIGTEATASASELIINGMQPYVPEIALIGSNTFGKPVGQSAFDLPACDDRVRAVTIQIENADGQGEYFRGLADTVPNSCSANDDLDFQLGDPREEMVATALDFLAGRPCNAIAGGSITTQSVNERGLLERPVQDRSAAQREVPGFF